MRKRVAVVTGATGVIGRSIVEGLLLKDVRVILPVRDVNRGQQLQQQLIHYYWHHVRQRVHESERVKESTCEYAKSEEGEEGEENEESEDNGEMIHIELVDLSDVHSIQSLLTRLCQRWETIDLLINNAAEVTPKKEMTSEGIERMFTVNVLAYHRLTTGLAQPLRQVQVVTNGRERGRVVNVASVFAGQLQMDDVFFTKRLWSPELSYRANKQANRMLCWAHSRRFRNDFDCFAVNPGFTHSKLTEAINPLQKPSDTASFAAATVLTAATDPTLTTKTGSWLVRKQVARCKWAKDIASQDALLAFCDSMLKIHHVNGRLG